jgi:hypothetical protein
MTKKLQQLHVRAHITKNAASNINIGIAQQYGVEL